MPNFSELKNKIPANYVILPAAFLTCAIIYFCQRLKVDLPAWINNYANDFLCLPLILQTMTLVIRRLKNDLKYRFPLIFVLLNASYYACYFEYYLPQRHPRYTADGLDIILYFSSSLLFYGFSRRWGS